MKKAGNSRLFLCLLVMRESLLRRAGAWPVYVVKPDLRSDRRTGPLDDFERDFAKGAVQTAHVGIVAAAGNRRGGAEAARRAHLAVAIVEQSHEQLDIRTAASVDIDFEGAQLGNDLIVDRQPLARQTDAGEGARTLECLGQSRLH